MSNAEVDFPLGLNPRSVIPLRDVILLRGDLVCSGIRLSPEAFGGYLGGSTAPCT